MDLDCRGLSCPLPVMRTKSALEELGSGTLRCLVDTRDAAENVSAFARRAGCSVEIEEDLDLFKVSISKEAPTEESPASNLVYLFTSRFLGEGDPELGGALMATFMYTLSEMRVPPRSLIFMNSGVYLTTKGSRVLDILKDMEEQGAEVLSCGTCLDYYGLKATLSVGRVTNMYEISEKVREGGKTISL